MIKKNNGRELERQLAVSATDCCQSVVIPNNAKMNILEHE